MSETTTAPAPGSPASTGKPRAGQVWVPLSDAELTWFVADEKLLPPPRPLEYTVEVAAFAFGLTRGLESLEFPITEVRPRLVDGRVYLAPVPSAQAETDIHRRMENVRDLSLRFTRNIKGFWEQQVRPKIEGYNKWMAEFVSASGSSQELAERLRELRRVRGNQWFNVIRPVVAPTALLHRWAEEAEQRGGDSAAVQSLVRAADDGVAATREALGLVRRGRTILLSALHEVGGRLTGAGFIDDPEDIFWLQWMEVRQTLQNGGDRRALVTQRKADASRSGRSPTPALIGPPLPPDAPRMYLIPEVLRLLG